MNQYCILVHYHELFLKKKNKSWFEKKLKKNICLHIGALPYKNINIYASRIFIHSIDYKLWDKYKIKLKNVMGLKNAILMCKTDTEIENIKNLTKDLIKDEQFESFRITTKRQDKSFHLTSHEINKIIGSEIQMYTKKNVSLNKPDINIKIELVRSKSYVGFKQANGYGGLPNGTSESAISLLSSGIDSPVASFQMLKRGVNVVYAHFHSAPATNKQSIDNCKKILRVLSNFQIKSKLYIYPILELQKIIMDQIEDKYWIIMFRRVMIKVSCMLAHEIKAKALITGENIGQVSSQTLSNIHSISSISTLPIIRPLAGHTKEEITNIATKIGTYEYSISPHQDCCSFFLPIHPELKSDVNKIEDLESKINFRNLFEQIVNERKVYQT